MTSLLNSIGKTPYQEYTIEHGVERIHIRVPLKEAREFEKEFNSLIADGFDSKEGLLRVVYKNGGSVRKRSA